MSHVDWLSHLLQIVSVTGQLEVRCAYGAPWRVAWEQVAANEIPYHIIVRGRAILEDPETRTARELASGDVVLLPHGAAHVLHDGSGQTPIVTRQHRGSAGWMLSENDGEGEQLDLMCGRFFVAPPHDRLIRNYMPAAPYGVTENSGQTVHTTGSHAQFRKGYPTKNSYVRRNSLDVLHKDADPSEMKRPNGWASCRSSYSLAQLRDIFKADLRFL